MKRSIRLLAAAAFVCAPLLAACGDDTPAGQQPGSTATSDGTDMTESTDMTGTTDMMTEDTDMTGSTDMDGATSTTGG